MIDPKNELTISVMQPSTAKTANWNSTVIDTQQYVGQMAVILNAGAKTAGDAGDTTLDVRLMHSAESNGANATNCSLAFTQVTTTNSHQTLAYDPRAFSGRYLKAVATIAGTNSPAFPVSMTILGTTKLQ